MLGLTGEKLINLGHCIVYDYELTDATRFSSLTDQVVLNILKIRGAPILGNFILYKDPKYSFECERDYSWLITNFYWYKLQDNK